jgi:hypothetical protein
MNRASVLLFATVISAALVLYPGQRALAHTFSGDESATFLTTVEQIRVGIGLAQENLDDSELATEHAEHAAEALTDEAIEELAERNERIATDLPASLEEFHSAVESGEGNAEQIADDIDSLLGEAVSVRIEQDQLNNSTIQALVVANLIDEALEHYGEAVGFEGDMTDMSSMNMTDSGMSGGMSMEDHEIVSEVDHQSAVAFAQRAEELYGQIKQDAVEGSADAVQELDSAFPEFVSAIGEGASPMDVMTMAHNRLHPNLMVAYDLQVIPEFPLPLLLLLPLLAAVVVIGRLRLKPNM